MNNTETTNNMITHARIALGDDGRAIVTECPFCGSEAVTVIEDGQNYCCLCGDCFAQGPAASGKSAAVNAWNERE